MTKPTQSILPTRMLGQATIRPAGPVVAGAFATIVYRYRTAHPIDDTGCLKIVFRYAGDFGTPQFDAPDKPNYCTVATTGDCRIAPRWDVKGHIRPWDKTLFLKVMGGYLNVGDVVTVTFGATAGGSPGWQMQTFCEESFEFRTLVDPIASYQFRELATSPTLRIVPGPPARAVCIAPSQVQQGARFDFYLKLEDCWGNPVRRPKRLRHRGFTTVGVQTVVARDGKTGLAAVGNPIEVAAAAPALRSYWADFHGQSEETIGSNTIDSYFAFARDKALLDISGHQGNDFQVTDAFWKTVNRLADAYTQAGRFVVFPGYEWSGNTPLGGDRNVYFSSGGGRITRSSNELLPDHASSYPVSATASDLFRNLRTQGRLRPFVFAHVGGRYADMRVHDPEAEVAVEIHSAWGTFEWLLDDALALGHRVGVCANSDGHKGRPGASYPGASRFGSYGGLTCVLATSLDRVAVREALQARHFYATTGHRCLLDVQLDTGTGGNAMMGDVIEVGAGTPVLHGRVAGTAPIERIDILNGTRVVKTIRPYSTADLGNRIKVVWSGAEVRGRDRKVEWDGALTVQGNAIGAVVPLNFWNVQHPLRRPNSRQLAWQSITTGGLTGCVIELERRGGTMVIRTKQGQMTCKLDAIGLRPRVRRFGGVAKQLAVYRLPDRLSADPIRFRVPLHGLHTGDNPVYLRTTQVDGHMAWSSPIYVVRSAVRRPARRTGP